MGKWVKGQSGNPRGRARTPPELTEACRRLSTDAITVLGTILRSKKHRPQDRIRAAEVLLDRGYGKATQAVELSGPEGGAIPVAITPWSDSDLAVLLERMARAGSLPVTGAAGEVAQAVDAADDAVHAAGADDPASGVSPLPAD